MSQLYTRQILQFLRNNGALYGGITLINTSFSLKCWHTNIAQSKEYETIPFNHFSSGGGPNTITNMGLLGNLYGLTTKLYGNCCSFLVWHGDLGEPNLQSLGLEKKQAWPPGKLIWRTKLTRTDSVGDHSYISDKVLFISQLWLIDFP